ncbi:mannose-6-phosphate isomerase class I [Dyadobacter jejuensis]|uniref:Mannose-6-phosphate isomerase class I n=1 Tax=Dyadobacter jejuensis TaxID=1082580 RepID=A0A316AWE6_9BACT|nr:class I mannose-6-phosphate isomerase [Dyadobacter jejuensis]PWJ54477.1 mannose-6-phosphate isomerase class I [Dyadobacter jejuensis]
MKKSNFNKFPQISVSGYQAEEGWEHITQTIREKVESIGAPKTVIVLDAYHGVNVQEILAGMALGDSEMAVFEVSSAMLDKERMEALVSPFINNDPVFGFVTTLELDAFFDAEKVSSMQEEIEKVKEGVVLVLGTGAALVAPHADVLIYADMPRWEIQLRFRKNAISNLGADNANDPFAYQYKRSFFVDWRVCDRFKKGLMDRWDFVLDTSQEHRPKMVSGVAMAHALASTKERPFRVVPFFDPGPWGGQWLKEVVDLDRSAQNYAWGFDCVPEENSLVFDFDGVPIEIPSINLVLAHPVPVLGEAVYDAFGAEFPIRFDFLDTMQGGNLSLQVHPMHQYIKDQFGMGYTQNESYYFLEAENDGFVYLGLKEDVDPESMMQELQTAQEGEGPFDAEKHVQKWPVKKHDHVLIPAGTVHCSGADTVVLEISATPFNFTFKLWDWGRMGLDGKPRPISLEHGKKNIQWDRTTKWTQENLVNRFEQVASGDGWREERTGLDTHSFIETRRHWFTQKVTHHTEGVVNVLNLISGREALVESPNSAFEPFVVHYAETFIVPAGVGAYTVRPYGESEWQECATIKASIRTNNLKENYRID